MTCPHCAATTSKELTARTQLGYRVFRCSACRRQFNERTGTPFNHLEIPTDIVLLLVLWRLRYKLSLRDLAEMFLERGFEFTHEAVRAWEARFAPVSATCLIRVQEHYQTHAPQQTPLRHLRHPLSRASGGAARTEVSVSSMSDALWPIVSSPLRNMLQNGLKRYF